MAVESSLLLTALLSAVLAFLSSVPPVSSQLSNEEQAKINSMPFPDYVRYYGYPVQTHKIFTQDGYILTFFRVQAKNSSFEEVDEVIASASSEAKGNSFNNNNNNNNNNQSQPKSQFPANPSEKPKMKRPQVVYLQHGFLDSSDSWVTNEEHLAPGLILAQNGFDVWFGNSRGNKHSKQGVNMSVFDVKFWHFSWQNMSEFDLPAAFEYIEKVTNCAKIHYMGHSQGTTVMFAALSEKNPTITRLLGHFVALAPVVFIDRATSEVLKKLNNPEMIKFLKAMNVGAIYETNQISDSLQSMACKEFNDACVEILELVASKDSKLINRERLPTFAGHYPAGGSLMTLEHWLQMKNLGRKAFRKYEHQDTKINLKFYGQEHAPEYDLSQVSHAVHMFVGDYDTISNLDDCSDLKEMLVNSRKAEVRVLHEFDHGTFLIGRNMDWFQEVVQIFNSQIIELTKEQKKLQKLKKN